MQIWKTPCKSGNRDANLENAAQIWKSRCKSGKRRANLENAVQIYNPQSKNTATRGLGEYRDSRWKERGEKPDEHVENVPAFCIEASPGVR
jgi:hypothetical protein